MRMGSSQGTSQRLEHRQELSLGQRHFLVQSQVLLLRLELIGAINGGERYRPKAKCPECSRDLTPLEILKGFNTDPNDFTTACTRCGTRFRPQLIWRDGSSRVELPFFCDLQTQAKMRGMETLSPEALRKEHPAVFHSAIAHHGLLKNAFATMGITYPFEEVTDMKLKVGPFLGRLPDTVIAELSSLKVSVVRRMRKTAGIKACSHESIIESAGDSQEVAEEVLS